MQATIVASTQRRNLHVLVREHESALYQRARRLCGQRSDAWDMVQDTFERALVALGPTYPDDKVRGWLFLTLKNLFIDRQRASRRQSHLPLSDDLQAPDTEPAIEPADWRCIDDEVLDACLRQLDPRLREVYVLRVTGGLSLASIGAQLGIPLATAGTRIHRARVRLRALLAAPRRPG